MQLDRNITNPRRGKYALIKLREFVPAVVESEVDGAGVSRPKFYEIDARAVDFGDTEDSDFFVIRLKDKYAGAALMAYAHAAQPDDSQYAGEVFKLALAAMQHPNRRIPD